PAGDRGGVLRQGRRAARAEGEPGVHPPPACRGDLLRRGAGERDVGGVAGGGPGGQDRSVLPLGRYGRQELLPVGYSKLRLRAVEVVPGVGLRRHVPRGGRACSVGRAPVRCAGSGPFHQLELTRTVSRFLAVNCPMGGPRTSRLTRRTPWPVTHCDATVAKSSAVLVPPPTLSTCVGGPAPPYDRGGTAVRVRPAVVTARWRSW